MKPGEAAWWKYERRVLLVESGTENHDLDIVEVLYMLQK
jgi:hypothetical protein